MTIKKIKVLSEKEKLQYKICDLVARYYDEYGSFEMDIWTTKNNECRICIDREWINGQK